MSDNIMELTGENFIGNDRSRQGDIIYQAVDPASEEKLLPYYFEATSVEVDQAVQKAESAFQNYRKKSGNDKAIFLEQIGDEIMQLGDKLIERCCRETGLPEARINGERTRTVNQLKLFAGLLKEGSWVDARIDTADPQRRPAPKPDIRSMQIGLGPVAIFGASNFPLAFSVVGGDTVSALAAGCTVVIKAHPAHPGTCEMIAGCVIKAVKKLNFPDGTFSMLQGLSPQVGMKMVNHPLIWAVGFTGSFKGGKAIFDAAVRRPDPIPVYAEMGSVNPVFVLPVALAEKSNEIADGLAASVTLGVGQFCTNPGIFVIEGTEEGPRFLQNVADNIKKIYSGNMLTSAICQSYQTGIRKLGNEAGVTILAQGIEGDKVNQGSPYLFQVSSENFLSNDCLEEEIFGPSTLAVTAGNKSDLIRVARKLKGHLTATIYATEKDLENYAELVSILERKAGRLIINGFPTGVEVCHSMVHGGPFPATTDSRTTSVGTAAIHRFTRPVCYQDFPDHLLPKELKENNPLQIWRLFNGERKNKTMRR